MSNLKFCPICFRFLENINSVNSAIQYVILSVCYRPGAVLVRSATEEWRNSPAPRNLHLNYPDHCQYDFNFVRHFFLCKPDELEIILIVFHCTFLCFLLNRAFFHMFMNMLLSFFGHSLFISFADFSIW